MTEATLITLQEAVLHLRLDMTGAATDSPPYGGDERLPDLQLKMLGAETIILDYLKTHDTGWDAETVPPPVKVSILLMLSALWDNRDGNPDFGDYLRPTGAIALLLARLRDPALA